MEAEHVPLHTGGLSTSMLVPGSLQQRNKFRSGFISQYMKSLKELLKKKTIELRPNINKKTPKEPKPHLRNKTN